MDISNTGGGRNVPADEAKAGAPNAAPRTISDIIGEGNILIRMESQASGCEELPVRYRTLSEWKLGANAPLGLALLIAQTRVQYPSGKRRALMEDERYDLSFAAGFNLKQCADA